ncbi:saga-associated factor 29 like protein b [Quercus suber]|uniref:Saga-associated factor 29 like protein b n=1 Tax=Quercus suber TaxID=58331 RepID=A0AAW0LQC2_QUESU
MSRIIPFPKRNDLSNVQDFPTGSQVLAVYPGTTALYKATVVNGHRKILILPFENACEFCMNLTTSCNFAYCGLLSIVPKYFQRKTDDYLLEFDDDEENGSLPKRIVPFQKVVPLPEESRQ